MTYSFSLYIVVLLFLIIGTASTKSNSERFVLLLFPVLVFYHAFIDVTSIPDLEGYCQAYEDIRSTNMLNPSDMFIFLTLHKFEVGYMFLMKISSWASTDFQIFLLFISCVLILMYLFSFVKYSSNVFISLVFFILIIFDQSMFVLRQHLAIAVLLLTIDSIINRKLAKFIIITALAFLLHKSSLPWFLVYFLYGIKNKKRLSFVLILTIICFYFVFNNLSFINNLFSLGYQSYIDGDKSGQSNLTSFFIITFILVMYFLTNRKKMFDDGPQKLFSIMLVIDWMLSFMGLNVSLLSRFALLFHISILFIVPMTFIRLKDRALKLFYLFLCLMIFTYINYFGTFSMNMIDGRFAKISIQSILMYMGGCVFFLLFLKKEFTKLKLKV